MSVAYQNLDRGHFDYDLLAVDGITGPMFRGPAVDRRRPYVACVGAAQTFGRFCLQPFPTLLAQRLQLQALNLGAGGVGPRWFDRPDVLAWLNGSEAVVLQVMAARNERNSMFDTRGTQHGIRVRDGKRMIFEHFFVDLAKTDPPETVERVLRETRANYVESMRRLLAAIQPPTILFWFSTRAPDYEDDLSAPWSVLGSFPQLVNRRMVDAIRAHSDAYVECVSSRGLPQPLWPADARIEGAILQDGMLLNRYYPSPEMHVEAAERLAPACLSLLGWRQQGVV